jgi:rhomboid family GlyGly-CTERM serine protease
MQEEYWRLISGHLVHSSLSHAFWDISLFALLSAYLEKKDPQRLMMGITLAVVGLSAFMLTPFVEIERYSGLSGVIYCLLIMAYWEWQKKHSVLIGLIPAVLVIGKTLMEWQSSEAVFVSDGWSVFVEAHLLGAAIGIVAILYIQFRKNSNHA